MTLQIARLIGAAGSGKTTELLRIMEAALPQLGNDPLRLGFASFTRAARSEAVGRASAAWRVPPSVLEQDGWFRTIHSTAMKCLGVGRGQLISDSQKDIEWISNALGVRLSTQIDDEAGKTRYIGDPVVAASLNCWSLARTALVSLEDVVRRMRLIDDSVPDYAAVVRTVEKYESQKRMDDRLDFNDLLLKFGGVYASPTSGMSRTTPQGSLPEVDAWLFDEQQDASPLLDLVCKRLVSAPTVRWCYVVGDPFQSIYGFAGSSAECFLGWPAAKERTMPKSYRCPAPILELGERCLRRMKNGYFDRKVAPADHEGRVVELGDLESAVSMAKPDENWLFIARTNYQAKRIYAALHSNFKPCRWVKSPDGTTSRVDGLKALYALEKDVEPITGRQWKNAMQLLPVVNKEKQRMLARGVKANWSESDSERWDRIFVSDLPSVGAEPELVELIRSGRWVRLVDKGASWREQAVRHGPELAAEPRISVGTIHAVKGAEADNVVVLTTSAQRIEQGLENPDQADEEHRIAYVAVTRAKRNLYVVNEGNRGRYVPSMEIL